MRQDGFGSGALAHAYARDSAHISGNLPQKHLEPRLRRAAEKKNPGNVRFQHEVISLTHDTDGVTAVVRSAAGESEIRARYALAADGGRTVAAAAGIAMSGLPHSDARSPSTSPPTCRTRCARTTTHGSA